MIRRLSRDLQIDLTPEKLILAVFGGLLGFVVVWLLMVFAVGAWGTPG